MSSTIEELTINYEEGDLLIVKELDKEVLTKGAWTTIIFRYQQWDNKKDDYGPEKYMIRRYRKMNGEYRAQSKFNISSPDQARKIIATLTKWVEDVE
ncbi:hypothetical protein [Halodesulfovibrio sp.]|jgi:hypothetical protein|uniref:hypothetical protein n=1 Tax=Halodesulfovibrio sp. TaxID=1912772 RepID=UPI0025FD5524|nr:hypothetical protein [Halodesulfovibrio sp.]MCT4534076.1 hypothetical protein [Halodesulfovibrio sp.]MCT4627575.1 hypothetical protein [Halodesulfovibrio sp.]